MAGSCISNSEWWKIQGEKKGYRQEMKNQITNLNLCGLTKIPDLQVVRIGRENLKSRCSLIWNMPRPVSLTSHMQFISSLALKSCSFRLTPKFSPLPLRKGHIAEAVFSVCYFLLSGSFIFLPVFTKQ